MGKTVQNYMLNEQVGEGTFAKVYKAKHILNGDEFAVKVISSEKFKQNPKLEECTVNEINILSQIRNECPYIVSYIDMLKTTNNFYFVYEFCNGGTLEKLIRKEGHLPEKTANRYLGQIFQAFKVLNKNNIMHRDLKPQNILLHNNNIKIADFSFCKLLENKNDLAQTMLGSPIYMAPEVLKGEIYTIKADVWSLGIVYFQMLFGRCPFESKSIAMLIKLLDKQQFSIPQDIKISAAAQQLLRRVIVKDYNLRISWEEIFNTYAITQQFQIVNKNDIKTQIQQSQLRSSLRNTGNAYSLAALRVSNSSLGPQSNKFNINQNTLMSPKSGNPYLQAPINMGGFNKSTESSSNNAESPSTKREPQRSATQLQAFNNLETSKNSTIATSSTQRIKSFDLATFQPQSKVTTPIQQQQQRMANTSIHMQPSNYVSKSEPPAHKNNRVQLTRLQIFVKNHFKYMQINQMTLDVLMQEQEYCNYICYFLFKSTSLQIESLHENLKKQNDGLYRQIKLAVESQYENLGNICCNILEAIKEQQKNKRVVEQKNGGDLEQLLFRNKHKILKLYIDSIQDRNEDIRLAAQVVDYLQQNIYIKKDAYERMSRDHLCKQMRNKLTKQ